MTTPPLVLTPGRPDTILQMPPDLGGYWWETDVFVCVPWVYSKNPGAFLRFLSFRSLFMVISPWRTMRVNVATPG